MTKLSDVDLSATGDSFEQRIKKMNETFKLDSNDKPTLLPRSRLLQFHKVVADEIDEVMDIQAINDELEAITQLSDVLADVVVYCFSEARRWGIPLIDVLHIVMDSQDSKLVDGEPLMAEDGSKFIKGSNYEPPEGKIRTLLQGLQNG
jgi:hypothetical protein